MDSFSPDQQNVQIQGQAPQVSVMHTSGLNVKHFFLRLAKYIVEGLAVAVACWIIPSKKSRPSWKEVAMIAVTAAAVFAILDLFAPSISKATRSGSGFALGTGIVGGIPFQ